MSPSVVGSELERDADAGPRVTLVGPLPPLRGGIAQHTGELRGALAARSRLRTLAFHRLYPQWIFPGESRLEPGEARVPSGTEVRGVRFEIDALDPRTWLRAVTSANDHGSEQVLIPWWTAALTFPIWTIARGCRRRGMPVTFICHNVVDHESSVLKRALARAVLSQGERFFVASEAEAVRLRSLLPGASVTVHPHPVYSHFPEPERVPPRRSRRELLFFGIIRPYKGLDVLLDALSEMPDDDWHLTVAGEPWQSLSALKEGVRSWGGEERVEWIEGYVPAQEVAALFRRADAVVLPYREATGCGVLALALGEGVPVVASDVPGLKEQVADGETGWLVPPGDPGALARALSQVDPERSDAMRDAVRRHAERWTWDSLARGLLGVSGTDGDHA